MHKHKLIDWLYDQQFNYEDSGKQMITEILEVLQQFKTETETQNTIHLQTCDCCGKELTRKNIKPVCKACFPSY